MKTTDTMYPVKEKVFSNPADFDREQIIAGLDRIGITSEYKIAVYNTDDKVAVNAAAVLARFFAKAGRAIETVKTDKIGSKQIVLIMNGSSDEQEALFKKNKSETLGHDKKDDVSHVFKCGDNIIIAGSNGRGVLYGEYEFEEFVMFSEDTEPNIVRKWDFRVRGQALGFYWNPYENFRNTEITDERIEYLSRLGTNFFFPCFDGSGYECFLMTLVKSEIFPNQNDPDEEFIEKIDKLIAILSKYGIDYYHWFTEPGIPYNMGGDLTKYPKGVLGSCDFHGKMIDTFCVNSPLVRAYYHEMVTKFIRRFPECKGIVLYNLDCNSWFCDPSLCENCKHVVSEKNLHNSSAWENVSTMVTLLSDAAHNEKPDFEVIFWPNIHHEGEDLQKLIDNSHYNALWGCWTGTDHDIILTKKARLVPRTVAHIEAAKKYNIPNYIGNIMNRSECIPQGFFYPISVMRILEQMNDWGFVTSIESTGPTVTCNSMVALTMKQCWSDSHTDQKKFLKNLLYAQLGKEAGDYMYECAEKTEDAMNAWEEYEIFSHPMGGSKSTSNIGHILNYPSPIDHSFLDTLNYWGMGLAGQQFIDDFNHMAGHLCEAAEAAKKAYEVASDKEYIRYAYYTAEGFDRPTCKEYAELNYATTKFASLVARQRVTLFTATNILKAIDDAKAAGQDASALYAEYLEWVKKDLPIQEEVLAFLRYHLDNNTYFVRASFRVAEMQSLIERTEKKLEIIHDLLK